MSIKAHTDRASTAHSAYVQYKSSFKDTTVKTTAINTPFLVKNK